MKRPPLNLEIRVSVCTDSPIEALSVRSEMLDAAKKIDAWISAPRAERQPASAEMPGDRENAGIVGYSIDSLAERLAAICPCPSCSAGRESKAKPAPSDDVLDAVQLLRQIMAARP